MELDDHVLLPWGLADAALIAASLDACSFEAETMAFGISGTASRSCMPRVTEIWSLPRFDPESASFCLRHVENRDGTADRRESRSDLREPKNMTRVRQTLTASMKQPREHRERIYRNKYSLVLMNECNKFASVLFSRLRRRESKKKGRDNVNALEGEARKVLEQVSWVSEAG